VFVCELNNLHESADITWCLYLFLLLFQHHKMKIIFVNKPNLYSLYLIE